MSLKFQVTFDCEDADRLAEFWAIALDYQLQPPPDGFDSWPAALEAFGIPVPPEGSVGAIVDPEAVGPRILFLRVPEPKSTKNRIHLDVDAGGDEAKLAKIAQLVEAGGTEIGRVDEQGSWWMVMHDPEGNEFCVVGRADASG